MNTPKTTARALTGLVNDLDEDRLAALTDSDNRPELVEFLDKLIEKAQEKMAPPEFAVWLTAKVGESKDADACLEAIKASGAQTGEHARGIMGKKAFKLSPEVREVSYVRGVTARLLGFTKAPTLKQFLERAEKFGLNRCIPEDGPVLRVAYTDQPSDKRLPLAMETIVDSYGRPSVFYLYCLDDGERWLSTYCVDPRTKLGLDYEWVFRK